MSNSYDSMAGGLSSGKALGEAAFVSSLVACSVWPELLLPVPAAKSGFLLNSLEKVAGKGWFTKSLSIQGQATSIGGVLTSVPMRLKLIITDTGQMLQACSDLHESGSTGLAYLEELNEIYYSINPASWQANDQVAYGEKLLSYRNSVQNTYCLAQESALIAAIVATLRFAQMAIAAVLAGVLAAMAVAFWIAMAIPFGQGFAMSIRTFGTSMVTMLKTVIQTMDEIMIMVGQGASAIMAVRTLEAGISDNIRLGENEGLKDLGGSAISVVSDMLERLSKGKLTDLSGF
jgi:hypothetical protein